MSPREAPQWRVWASSSELCCPVDDVLLERDRAHEFFATLLYWKNGTWISPYGVGVQGFPCSLARVCKRYPSAWPPIVGLDRGGTCATGETPNSCNDGTVGWKEVAVLLRVE